jgi:methionine-rich copper-binding protein CopC
MKMIRLAALSLLFMSALVSAHTRLSSSVPAENAAIATSPETIDLEFSTEVRLTALSLTDQSGATFDLGALPKAAQSAFAIPAPALPPGQYTLSWRAVGADTHVVSGELHFAIAIS